MKLLNLTSSVIILPVGALKVRVEPKSISNSIVATSNVIKGSIIPLINLYGENFRVIPNSADYTIIEQDGCGIPAENIVGLDEATKLLEAESKETSETSNNIKDDLGAGVPIIENEVKPEDIKMPEVKVIKGKRE